MKRIFFAILLLIAGVTTAVAQSNVTNIRMEQRDTVLVIKYDLEYTSNIKILVSMDEEKMEFVTMYHITGDFGDSIAAGKDKTILWSAFTQFGAFKNVTMRFKIIAERNVTPKQRFLMTKDMYLTANVGYMNSGDFTLGATFGMVKHLGWFVSLQTGLDFTRTPKDAVSNNGGFVNEAMPYYKGNYVHKRLSVTGGLLVKVTKPLLIKVGAGYGHQMSYWETIDKKWVLQKDYSAIGVDVIAGLQFHFGGFVVSADAVTTNFKFFEGRIGLGWILKSDPKRVSKNSNENK